MAGFKEIGSWKEEGRYGTGGGRSPESVVRDKCA